MYAIRSYYEVKEGYSLCSSNASYGYDREPGKKIQTINEEEAVIVREIFDRYVNQNMSMNSIVRLLNLREIPSKKGKLWERKNLKNILTNATYIGKVRHFINDEEHYVELEGLHEPIISKELFEQAAKLAKKNKATSSTKRPVEQNYYQGFLYCSKCGSNVITSYSIHYTKLYDGFEEEKEGGERCFRCYKMRLEETAILAKEKGFDYFTTTLSISPHKNSQVLNQIGEKLEKEYGVKYLYSDFKKKNGYKRSIRNNFV